MIFIDGGVCLCSSGVAVCCCYIIVTANPNAGSIWHWYVSAVSFCILLYFTLHVCDIFQRYIKTYSINMCVLCGNNLFVCVCVSTFDACVCMQFLVGGAVDVRAPSPPSCGRPAAGPRAAGRSRP